MHNAYLAFFILGCNKKQKPQTVPLMSSSLFRYFISIQKIKTKNYGRKTTEKDKTMSEHLPNC